jgi:hypothetical protein
MESIFLTVLTKKFNETLKLFKTILTKKENTYIYTYIPINSIKYNIRREIRNFLLRKLKNIIMKI